MTIQVLANDIIFFVYMQLILMVMSLSDVKTKIVDDKIQCFALLIVLEYIMITCKVIMGRFVFSAIVMMVLLIAAIVSKGGLGGADIKIYTICCLYAGIKNGICLFIISIVLAVIYGTVKRFVLQKDIKDIAMLPFIQLASIIVFYSDFKSLY